MLKKRKSGGLAAAGGVAAPFLMGVLAAPPLTGVMINLLPRAKREAKIVVVLLLFRVKRVSVGETVNIVPRAKRKAKGVAFLSSSKWPQTMPEICPLS